MKVMNIMTKRVVTVERDASVMDVMKKMFDNAISSVIVESGDKGYGIITRKDIIAKVIAKGRDPESMNVGDILSEPLITVPPETDLREVAKMMAENNIRRLPIMEDGKIIGLVSSGDILKFEAKRI